VKNKKKDPWAILKMKTVDQKPQSKNERTRKRTQNEESKELGALAMQSRIQKKRTVC